MRKLIMPLLLAVCSVQAFEIEYSRGFDACMDRTGGATLPMVKCISAETQHQDNRLNRIYKELMATLSPQRKQELRDAQRLWIKYRDANCAFYFDPDGGTMVRIEAAQCRLTATGQRATELQSFLPTE
jgi:uncharacterized protein YecT (DUF1311 family)